MNYHARIMNLPSKVSDTVEDAVRRVYQLGHRDARHDAAEIAAEADAEIAELTGELEDTKEILSYRDRDIEKFRKGVVALTTEIAQLKAKIFPEGNE